ncbi:hypothetical protein DK28_0205145 [Peptococcaceae bacterium SCADC1_2_3]|jgi:hypothetical protein|nr:hypothetical protein DK28_0205145 [Peptococcaceae bacterium SCADC1_2_3]KFI34392.1 hypothetical protein HY00_02525 [Peptococcaceae bacterium SCADC1_2_3]
MEPKTLRRFLLFFYLILILVPVLVVAAFVIPMFTSAPEKPPGLSKEEEFVAEFALNQTRQFIGGSLEPTMVMRMRVIDIHKKPGKTNIYLPDSNAPDGIREYTFQKAYTVKVKLYTFFGLSWSTIKLKLGEGEHGEISRI